MLEWLKRHAWKACKPLKGFTSSNLVLSAKIPYRAFCEGFFVSLRVSQKMSQKSGFVDHRHLIFFKGPDHAAKLIDLLLQVC